MSPLLVPWVEAFTAHPFSSGGMRPPVGGDGHHIVEVHVGELSHHLGDYSLAWPTEGGSQVTGLGGAWPLTEYLMLHLNAGSNSCRPRN